MNNWSDEIWRKKDRGWRVKDEEQKQEGGRITDRWIIHSWNDEGWRKKWKMKDKQYGVLGGLAYFFFAFFSPFFTFFGFFVSFIVFCFLLAWKTPSAIFPSTITTQCSVKMPSVLCWVDQEKKWVVIFWSVSSLRDAPRYRDNNNSKSTVQREFKLGAEACGEERGRLTLSNCFCTN